MNKKKLIFVYIALMSLPLFMYSNVKSNNIQTEPEKQIIQKETTVRPESQIDFQVLTEKIKVISSDTMAKAEKEFANENRVKYSEKERYLLAKMAMAEAEGCDMYTKANVIGTIINRVESDKFPNTIWEVLTQENQFSPMQDGRWEAVEPNYECFEALDYCLLFKKYTNSLYFESNKNKENWHSRNLSFIVERDGMRFYK